VVKDDLLKSRHIDLYTEEPILATTVDQFEIDHIFELNLATKAYDQLHDVQKASVKEPLCKTINSINNLNFTSKEINDAKYDAIKAFTNTEHHVEEGLVPYLNAEFEKHPSIRIGGRRALTRNIGKAIVASYDKMEATLVREYAGIDGVDSVVENLHDIVNQMRLY